MSSAFISIEKLKGNEITKAYNHNCRVNDCTDTADPKLKHLNREIVSLNGESYQGIVDKEINKAIQNQNSNKRSNDIKKAFHRIFKYNRKRFWKR